MREFRNAVQRFLILPERHSLPSSRQVRLLWRLSSRSPPVETWVLSVSRAAKQAMPSSALTANVLRHTGGNVTGAAAIAEVSQQMVQKLMHKHGIS